MKIKKGDTVMIAIGKDRGKQGKVLRVAPKERMVYVEGAVLQIRHRRPRRAREKGERVTIPGPIAVANVRFVCPSCGKPTRVGAAVAEGAKRRSCKKCGSVFV